MPEAVLDAFGSGLTDDLFCQRDLMVFHDILAQALEFCKMDFYLGAAIYGRLVLETIIKKFAKKKNINTDQNFDKIIFDLIQSNIINQSFEISLRANYKFDLLAAHGREEL